MAPGETAEMGVPSLQLTTVNWCKALTLAVSACLLVLAVQTAPANAGDVEFQATTPIKSRNMDVSREAASDKPRSEIDQALAEDWPLYRSERSQESFNDTMATLKVTQGTVPKAAQFRGCRLLLCEITLPKIDEDGWLPAGRIWVSPNDYMLIVHSPKLDEGKSYRRRGRSSMKVFVLHEFQSNTLNTDAFDTISSHRRSVFVPLYMSKEQVDAKGRKFVAVVQVAPYDVISRHATNWGHAGPGIEVAKNTADVLEPLQSLAGIVVTSMIKTAAPHLRVVHHRGFEGLPMLRAYERRLAKLDTSPKTVPVVLPFVPAKPDQVAAASAPLNELIKRPDLAAPAKSIPVAQRAIIPPQAPPRLIGPIQLARRPAHMLGGVAHP